MLSADETVRSAAAGAVIANPLAGRFEENLSPLADTYCKPLGHLLAERNQEWLRRTSRNVPHSNHSGTLVRRIR
jgi:hypothetical protein